MHANLMTRKSFLRSVAAAVGPIAAIGLGWGRQTAALAAPAHKPAAASGSLGPRSVNAMQEPAVGPDPPMVRIAGGDYPIGVDGGPADAGPAHVVALEPFLFDQFEVTNAQFATFLNALAVAPARDAAAGAVTATSFQEEADLFIEGGEGEESQRLLIALDDEHSRIGIVDGRFIAEAGFEGHPVSETSWRGAREFCAWRGARLPTEVEWEAAARGAEGRTYPWGEEEPTPDRAVFGRASGETDAIDAHPAGATPEGAHGLAGNLQEWTSTLYRPYPYRADDREDPNDAGERVTRGGDHVYDSSPATLTGYYRTGFSRAPGRGHRHIGFRCARSLTVAD